MEDLFRGEEVVCGITYFCAFPVSLGSITIYWGKQVCRAEFVEFVLFSQQYQNENVRKSYREKKKGMCLKQSCTG